MAKARCFICGKELGLLASSAKISDGVVCSDCLERAGIDTIDMIINGPKYNRETLRKYLDERRILMTNFHPTQKIGKYLAVDENSRKFKIGSDIFSYDNLVSFELQEDGQTVTKSGLGRAIVGGVLFGGVGAIVGGVTGRSSKNVCSSMSIRVSLRNASKNTVYMRFISTKTKTDSYLYRTEQANARNCIEALQKITDANQNSNGVQTFSVADEILKFKGLLDQGIITQEEFDAKKKELLGI